MRRNHETSAQVAGYERPTQLRLRQSIVDDIHENFDCEDDRGAIEQALSSWWRLTPDARVRHAQVLPSPQAMEYIAQHQDRYSAVACHPAYYPRYSAHWFAKHGNWDSWKYFELPRWRHLEIDALDEAQEGREKLIRCICHLHVYSHDVLVKYMPADNVLFASRYPVAREYWYRYYEGYFRAPAPSDPWGVVTSLNIKSPF